MITHLLPINKRYQNRKKNGLTDLFIYTMPREEKSFYVTIVSYKKSLNAWEELVSPTTTLSFKPFHRNKRNSYRLVNLLGPPTSLVLLRFLLHFHTRGDVPCLFNFNKKKNVHLENVIIFF